MNIRDMSSHHFVKEGQEPALVIIDPVPFDLVAPLLEWAPYVVVFETAVEQFQTWGVKADAVIVANESESRILSLLHHQLPLKFIIAEPDGQFIAGINHLVDRDQAAATIVTNDGKNYLQDCELQNSNIELTVIDKQVRWVWAEKGEFKKWIAKDHALYAATRFKLSVVNARGEGTLENPFVALTDSVISLRGTAPFWVGEPHE